MKNHAPFDPRITLRPVDEIIPGLFQGMRPRHYGPYDLAVSCEQHLARTPMEGYEGLVLHVPMQDEDWFVPHKWKIDRVVDLIVSVLQMEGKVLVHCTGGLNRSSVVTARAIEAHLGVDAHTAVRMIRGARDGLCLHNRAFERWVLREELPTAETSAFRVQ